MGLSTNGQSRCPTAAMACSSTVPRTATRSATTTNRSFRKIRSRETFGYGIDIFHGAHDNEIFNGVVGANVLATVALGNRKGGIFVGNYASHNYFGGPSDDRTQAAEEHHQRQHRQRRHARQRQQLYGGDRQLDRPEPQRRQLPNSGNPIVVKPGSVHNTIRGNVTQ